MQQYPVSILAFEFDHLSFQTVSLESDGPLTPEQVKENAMTICQQVYPATAGWSRHHVFVGSSRVYTVTAAAA